MITKRRSEIIEKLNNQGVNIDSDNDSVSRRVNEYLKENKIKEKRAKFKNMSNVTEYLEDEIGKIHIIAYRTENNTDKENYYQDWHFAGYCTFSDIKPELINKDNESSSFYSKFTNKYGKYNCCEYDLYLNVFGGMKYYFNLVKDNVMKDWSEQGISIFQSGFDSDGEYCSAFDKLYELNNKLRQIKFSAEMIKEKVNINDEQKVINFEHHKFLKKYQIIKDYGMYEDYCNVAKW